METDEHGSEGGDWQTGATYSRRFRLDKLDGTFAFVTFSAYVTTEYRELDEEGNTTGAVSTDKPDGDDEVEGESFETFLDVEEQTEYLICSDAEDLGGSEIWSDYAHDYPLYMAPRDAEGAENSARAMVCSFGIGYINAWNGEAA